jgi:tetratricopeptide (TPR) repeat protein
MMLAFSSFAAINPAFSQSKPNVDSLTAVLNKYPKEDTVKAKLLIALSEATLDVNIDKSLMYSDNALSIITNFNAPELKADALMAKASCLNKLNKYTEIIELANNALAIYERLRLVPKIASTYRELGLTYMRKLDTENAIKRYERSLALGEQTGDESIKMKSLRGIGKVYLVINNFKKANNCYEQALVLAQKLNDREEEAIILSDLSTSYYTENNFTKSLEYVQRAIIINENRGNISSLTSDYRRLGDIYTKLQDTSKALIYYNKALKIVEETGDKTEAYTLTKSISIVSGKLDVGVAYFEKMASEHEKTGNYEKLMYNYWDLAYFHVLKADNNKTIEYYKKALEIALKIGKKQEAARFYAVIGYIYKTINNYTKSLEYLQKGLIFNESVKNNIATKDIYIGLIEVYRELSDFEKSLDYANKALVEAQKTDNKNFEAIAYFQLGVVYTQLNRDNEALERINKSIEIYKTLGNIAGVNNNMSSLGNVYVKLGRKLEAHRCFQEAIKGYKKLPQNYRNMLPGLLVNVTNLYIEEPDTLLQQMGVNQNDRYIKATELATEALKISRETGILGYAAEALNALSTIHEKNKDYIKAYDTYKQYITLKDSISGDDVKKQITRKEIQYEFDKKETELKYQQQLTAGELDKQRLQTAQREQDLLINQQTLTLKEQALALSNKEKDLTHLAYLKEQAEKQEKEQELSLSQEREKGKERDLNLKNLELSAQQRQNLYLGLLSFLLLGGLGTLSYFYTTLKKQKNIIARQNELNEQTIAILSHDIKEPLLGVKLMLKKLNKDDPFVAQASKSLEGQINSVNGILTNLLKMKKVASLKKDKNAVANVNAVVTTVIQELNVAIQTKSLTIENELEPDVMLPIAPEKLQIIIHNLLSNAVKYSFLNQKIRIFREGQGICIQDFGIGLSPEQRSKLMREVTASERGTHQERGNGLGLFLVGSMLQGEQLKVIFDSPETGGTIAKVLR